MALAYPFYCLILSNHYINLTELYSSTLQNKRAVFYRFPEVEGKSERFSKSGSVSRKGCVFILYFMGLQKWVSEDFVRRDIWRVEVEYEIGGLSCLSGSLFEFSIESYGTRNSLWKASRLLAKRDQQCYCPAGAFYHPECLEYV